MSGSIVGVFVLALVTVAQQATPPAASAPPSSGDPWAGRWSISETTRDGQSILVRRNATAAALVADPRFPERVTVAVPLPRGADYTPAADLNAIEEHLVDALERDRRAIGVLVLTTDARREFVFYTSDAASAIRAIDDLGTTAAPYELVRHAERDPQWTMYGAFTR
jgi:hypothetical protein